MTSKEDIFQYIAKGKGRLTMFTKQKEALERHTVVTLFCVAIVAAVATWSNISVTEIRSILFQPYLDKNHPTVQAIQKSTSHDVINSNDVFYRITLHELSVEALTDAMECIHRVEMAFSEARIAFNNASLTTMTDYSADPVDYYLTPEAVVEQGPEAWVQYVQSKTFLNNVFIAQLPDGRYTLFGSIMPKDPNIKELLLYQTVWEFEHGQPFTWHQMYFGDLVQWVNRIPHVEHWIFGTGWTERVLRALHVPLSPNKVEMSAYVEIEFFGWSLWRTLINILTFSFIFSVLICGSVLPALVILSFLGSWRQMAVAVINNVIVLWVMRSLIGFADVALQYFGMSTIGKVVSDTTGILLPFSMHEETYTVLAYVPIIMLNYSFAMRSLRRWNVLHYAHPDLSRSALWRMVLRDATLKLSIRYVCIVASMDFFLFMFLQHIVHARSMATVAILVIVTMVGVVMPFTVRMIAAWHMVIGGIGVQPKTLETAWWERVVVRYATWRFAPHCSGMTIVTIVTVVVTLYLNGFLNVDSNPGAFLRRVSMGKTLMTLEQPGQPGGAIYKDFIGFRGDDLSDPSFVADIAAHVRQLRHDPAVRGVLSPTDFLEEVLVKDFSGICDSLETCLLPHNQKRIAEVTGIPFRAVLAEEWELIAHDPQMAHTIALSDNSMIISVTGKTSRASDMRAVYDAIMQSGQELLAAMVDPLALYIIVDNSIINGYIANYVGAPIGVALLVGGMLLWQARRTRMRADVHIGIAGFFVAMPFVVSTSMTMFVMMMADIPMDISTAAIGNITISAAADLPTFVLLKFRELLAHHERFAQCMRSGEMVDELVQARIDITVNGATYVPLAIPQLVVFDPILKLGIMLLVALGACYIGTVLCLPFLRWGIVRRK